jgi:hypothetical protein
MSRQVLYNEQTRDGSMDSQRPTVIVEPGACLSTLSFWQTSLTLRRPKIVFHAQFSRRKYCDFDMHMVFGLPLESCPCLCI